jgi:zona occludens toxin (predicted ATPase)
VSRSPARLDAVWRVSLECALSISRKPCAFLFSIAKHPNQSRLIAVVKVAFTRNIDQFVTLM